MVFASCLNNNQEGEKNETACLSLSQKDWRVWTFDDVTVINLMGVFSEVDTFDVHEVLGTNYANSDTLKIKFLTGYDIVSAEKVTCYYPTIWSSSNDNVMQFIYLFNLCYKDTMPLNIHSGMIEYPFPNFCIRLPRITLIIQRCILAIIFFWHTINRSTHLTLRNATEVL